MVGMPFAAPTYSRGAAKHRGSKAAPTGFVRRNASAFDPFGCYACEAQMGSPSWYGTQGSKRPGDST